MDLAAEAARELELRDDAAAARDAIERAQVGADEASGTLAVARDELAAGGRELDNLRAAFEERARTRAFLERRLGAIAELEPDLTRRLADLENAGDRRTRRASGGRRAPRAPGQSRTMAPAKRRSRRCARNMRRPNTPCARTNACTEELKDDLSELVREAAVIRGRLADLSGERSDLEAKLAAGSSEMPELGGDVRTRARGFAIAESALNAAQEDAARLEIVRRETADREIESRSAVEHQASRLEVARTELVGATARAQRIMPNGAGDKLRTVLESLNSDRPLADPALLLEVVKAPPALEPALRAVLGDQLDAVIVDSPLFALRAIEILKQNNGGRLNFIPRSDRARDDPLTDRSARDQRTAARHGRGRAALRPTG